MLWMLACGSDLPTAIVQVDGQPVQVEVASTFASRQQGLMHRDGLPADAGMLFIYADEQVRGFWMKDTRVPLSIAFLNRRGEVLRIADMTPFDTDRVSSLVPATYALEMNQGWFTAHGVERGDRVTDLPKVEAE